MVQPPSLPESRARQAALGLAVGLLVVAGLQLADPGYPPADDPPTDLDGPAAALADAMRTTESTSHVQREAREGWNASTDAWGTAADDYARMAYEPGDSELVTAGFQPRPPGADPRWVSYTTGDAQWTRLTADGGWELRRAGTTYADVTAFETGALANATVSRRATANGTVVYDLHNETAPITTVVGEPFTDRGEPRVTVSVDADTGLVERVRIVRPPSANESPSAVRLTIRYERYGDTTVERPDGVPRVSPGLLLRDLLHGPVFSPG
ncbi:hypothetical protein [Halorarius halobius]|uniref:hypothetical protein n=1 Tax=Halorarius halobius TaxID=2962671 RepID=UPI0020CC1BFB|nr:hypothetical protein [Halorarius halobius]